MRSAAQDQSEVMLPPRDLPPLATRPRYRQEHGLADLHVPPPNVIAESAYAAEVADDR